MACVGVGARSTLFGFHLFLNPSMISFACSTGGAAPDASRHLKPFHSIGLWLAVEISAPSACVCNTITPTVGVMATPRSVTRQPARSKPSMACSKSSAPLSRPSRPVITCGALFECSINHEPKAKPNACATCGVMVFPTMPRAPETLSIKGAEFIVKQ